MRIYDEEHKRPLTSILIMLTPSEVRDLLGQLKSLDVINDHIHVDDEQYKREITIGLYTPQNIHNFSDEVIKLIQQDD